MSRLIGFLLAGCFLLLASCSLTPNSPNFSAQAAIIKDTQLLFDKYWEIKQKQQASTWPSLDVKDISATTKELKELRDAAASVPSHQLDLETFLDRQLFIHQLDFEINQSENILLLVTSDDYLWPILAIQQLLLTHTITNISDAQAYIERLNKLPQLLLQWQEHFMKAVAAGYVSSLAVEDLQQQLTSYQLHNLEQSILWKDFTYKVKQLDIYANTEQQLFKKARLALQRSSLPAYQRLQKTLQTATLQRHDTQVLSSIEGQQLYRKQLDSYADKALGALQIHELGKVELLRLQKEIAQLAGQLGMSSPTKQAEPAFFHWLAQHPLMTNNNVGSTLQQGAVNMASALSELPSSALVVNSTLTDYGSILLPNYSPAYRNRDLQARYFSDNHASHAPQELANLTSIPFIHAQYALLQENDHRPDFIRFTQLVSHNVGLSLYGQQLTTSSAEQQLGYLINQLNTVNALLVDTGIFGLGWSLSQSLEFLHNNAALTPAQQQSLITQIVRNPGQAVTGSLQLQRLQQLQNLAQKKLGARFDAQQFHTYLLKYGPLPLESDQLLLSFWYKY